MRRARIYTDSELQLITDVSLSAREIALQLNTHPSTINRMRKSLDVKVSTGTKKGPNIKLRRRITKTCEGKNCSVTFEAGPENSKRFCSHSCQMRTIHQAPKGKGSRSIRNPNISEYKRYSRLVHALSNVVYMENIDVINPNRYPRTLCGVEGGWQLDHIKSIKECFQNNITAEEASSLNNLRMLPWKDNLMRQYNKWQ